MKLPAIPTISVAVLALCLPACNMHKEEEASHHHEANKIVTTSSFVNDVVVSQRYVCLIHSRQHIKVKALQSGFLDKINVREGQSVKAGEVLFELLPTIYQARLDAEKAEARRIEQEYKNSNQLSQPTTPGAQPVVAKMEVVLKKAELDRANAKVLQAQTELDFCTVKAKFDGVVDRQYQQLGSLIKEGDILTTLSDNSVMWVYFNVPEVRYFDYKGRQSHSSDNSRLELVDTTIELILANGTRFNQNASNTVTLEGEFNNETGNIQLRADFPNPDRLLRHGQTGTLQMNQKIHKALVIPQRAVFEVLDKQYVWVVGEDKVVHRRLITVAHEMEDKFVIGSGLTTGDKFVLEGVSQVRENDKLEEVEYEKPETILRRPKYEAE